MNYLVVSLIGLSLTLPVLAREGGGDSGGGSAVICRNGKKIVSVELLDLYEARVLHGKKIPSRQGSPLEIAKAMEKEILWGENNIVGGELIPEKGNALRSMVGIWGTPLLNDKEEVMIDSKYMAERMHILPKGVGLAPVKDTNHIAVPERCKIEQAAVFRDSDERLFVQGDIWEKFDATNKAALLVHETIYTLLRNWNETTSERARLAVGMAFAGEKFENIVESNDGIPSAWSCMSKGVDFANGGMDYFRSRMRYWFNIIPAGGDEQKPALISFAVLDGKLALTRTTVATKIPYSNFPAGEGIEFEARTQSLIDRNLRFAAKLTKTIDEKTFEMDVVVGPYSAEPNHTVVCEKSETQE